MKKLLLRLGFVSVADLLEEVREYETAQNKIRQKLHAESIEHQNKGETDEARSVFYDGLLVGYQGIGALDFVGDFIGKRYKK